MNIIDEKKEAVFQSKGWQAFNRLGMYAEIYSIFIDNYYELMDEINKIQSSKMPVVAHFENRQINRRIFNFFAPTKAMTDNCRNLMSYYEDTIVYENFIKQKDLLFKDNPLVAFVQKFRNNQTHIKLGLSWLSNSNKVIFLTEELLRDFKEWNGLSKKYIEQSGNEIILENLCAEYFKLQEQFYAWLTNEIKNFHKEDFKETIYLASKTDIKLSPLYYQFSN